MKTKGGLTWWKLSVSAIKTNHTVFLTLGKNKVRAEKPEDKKTAKVSRKYSGKNALFASIAGFLIFYDLTSIFSH